MSDDVKPEVKRDEDGDRWLMPVTSIAEQAAARGEPLPAPGTLAGELISRGYEIADHIDPHAVFWADPKSPTGYAWRLTRDLVEFWTAGKAINARYLRAAGILPPHSVAPNWAGVKEYVYDENDHLERVVFWEGPTPAEVIEENARCRAIGLEEYTEGYYRKVAEPEFALAMADAADVAVEQERLLDKVSKDGGLP